MKKVSVTAVKDEAPYIVEWVAYQHLLGFDEIIIASNDSTDGTVEILDRLAAFGLCKAIHFNRADHKEAPQIAAMGIIGGLPQLSEPCLLLVSDVDEYLQVNVGNGTLNCLLNAAPDFDLMFIRWRVFGSGGALSYEDRPTIDRFRYSSPTSYIGQIFRHGHDGSLGKPDYTLDELPEDHFNRHQSQRWTRTYKTLFKYLPGDRLSVHFPRLEREPLTKIDSGGRLNPNERYSHLSFYGEHTYEGSYDLCQLNHYANRSVDEYILKMVRGDGVYAKDPRGLDHWKIAECNERHCNAMDRWSKPLADLIDDIVRDCDLKAVLAKAHSTRQQKLEEALAANSELALLRNKIGNMAGASFAAAVAAE